jgi:mRNA-degrading endonuclease RelE of RelBE toxin-antitoxin system
VTYRVVLSDRAARDLDKLSRDVCERMMRRLEQIAEDPFDARLTAVLTGQAALRKSPVGGWRIIFTVDTTRKTVSIVTIERRGQVYRRL